MKNVLIINTSNLDSNNPQSNSINTFINFFQKYKKDFQFFITTPKKMENKDNVFYLNYSSKPEEYNDKVLKKAVSKIKSFFLLKRKIIKAIKKSNLNNIDYLVSISMPLTAHSVGLKIKAKKKIGIFYDLGFKQPIIYELVKNSNLMKKIFLFPLFYIYNFLNKNIEKEVFKKYNLSFVNHSSIKRNIKINYKNINSKISILEHSHTSSIISTNKNKNELFTIVHSGKLYDRRITRNGIELIKAVANFPNTKLLFLGNVSKDHQKYVLENKIDNVHFVGLVSQSEVHDINSKANLLVSIDGIGYKNCEPYPAFPSKIVDYSCFNVKKLFITDTKNLSPAFFIGKEFNIPVCANNMNEIKEKLSEIINNKSKQNLNEFFNNYKTKNILPKVIDEILL